MPSITGTGKAAIVRTKVGDRWLILDDIGSADQPMVPSGGGTT